MINSKGLMMIEQILNAIYLKKTDFSEDEKKEMVSYVENFAMWELWLCLMDSLKYKKQDMYDAIEAKFVKYNENVENRCFSEN